MAKSDRSISERHGYNAGVKSLFGSLDPGELTEKARRELSAASSYRWLRRFLIDALGLTEKPNPEYLIIMGCIRPFDVPMALLNYFRLLDQLGIAYAFLRDREYCSNLPAYLTARGKEDWEAADAGAKELREMNLAHARALGVKAACYFCSDGFAIAQRLFKKFGSDMEPLYCLDIVKERLGGRALQLSPRVIGYYQGCWREQFELNPKLEIDFAGYRTMMDTIEGIEVVDLPRNLCCKRDISAVVEAAERQGVNCIVTPCAGCQLRVATLRRVPALMLSDIVLEAVSHEGIGFDQRW